MQVPDGPVEIRRSIRAQADAQLVRLAGDRRELIDAKRPDGVAALDDLVRALTELRTLSAASDGAASAPEEPEDTHR